MWICFLCESQSPALRTPTELVDDSVIAQSHAPVHIEKSQTVQALLLGHGGVYVGSSLNI